MKPTVSSETSAVRTQTPGNYPKRNTLHLEHSESLKTATTRCVTILKSAVLSYYAVVPKSLLHGIPITATAQDLHHAQYLQPHKIIHGPNDSNPPNKKNQSSTLHPIAILVPQDELVMKTYMHIQ